MYDSTYLLVIIGIAISFLASMNVKSTYRKYGRIFSTNGITSERVAAGILQASGIYDVRIERIGGDLTDHYSPSEKVLRLSDSVYGSSSVAAIGVAAHECGHAIQHQCGYGPLKLRTVAVPMANIGSRLSWPVILVGLLIGSTSLASVGIYLFLMVVIFQLVTLPVEFNASNRALKILNNNGFLNREEMRGAGKVLGAAAMTYVAALFSTVLQLLRLIMIVNNGGGRRRR